MRYDVFVSYSHRDKAFAEKLEGTLKHYRSPLGSNLQRRLSVFRDEAEANGICLTEELSRALASSRKLVVVCSPAARESAYVNEEIAAFVATRGASNIIPVLAAGMPNDEAVRCGKTSEAAFPPALIDALGDTPWAPDFRDFDQKGKRIPKMWPAWFHLLAAIYEVARERIEQTERRRRVRRGLGAVAVVLAVAVAGVAYFQSNRQRESLDLANQSEALRLDKDRREALTLALRAVRAYPTDRAKDVLATLLDKHVSDVGRRETVIALDAKSRSIAEASPVSRAVILDIATMKRVSLCGNLFPITSLEFSPDGATLTAYSHEDGLLQTFDTASGKRLSAVTRPGYRDPYDFNPASAIARTSEDLSAPLLQHHPELKRKYGWDAAASGTNRTVREFTVGNAIQSPNGTSAVATVEYNDAMIVFTLPDFDIRYVKSWSVSDQPIPVYSKDGEHFAVVLYRHDRAKNAILGETLIVMSPQSAQELWSRTGESLEFGDFAFSDDGIRLVTWSHSLETTVTYVFDALTGRVIATLTPDADKVKLTRPRSSGTNLNQVLHIDDAGRRIVSRTDDTAYIWDVDRSTALLKLNLFDDDEKQRQADDKLLATGKGWPGQTPTHSFTDIDTNTLLNMGDRYLNACR